MRMDGAETTALLCVYYWGLFVLVVGERRELE